MPSPALMAPITRNFVAAIEALGRDGNIDLVRFAKGERKDDRTQATVAADSRAHDRRRHVYTGYGSQPITIRR